MKQVSREQFLIFSCNLLWLLFWLLFRCSFHRRSKAHIFLSHYLLSSISLLPLPAPPIINQFTMPYSYGVEIEWNKNTNLSEQICIQTEVLQKVIYLRASFGFCIYKHSNYKNRRRGCAKLFSSIEGTKCTHYYIRIPNFSAGSWEPPITAYGSCHWCLT